MAIEYKPQYSLLATVTNAGTFAVQVTTMPAVSVTVVAVTVSNLASVPLTMSGTTIAITSIGTMPNISVEAATVSNLASVPLTVSGTTIAITSLPALTTASVTISNIVTTVTINSIVAQATHWNVTGTWTAAQTTGTILKVNPGSTSALYITDIIASNENTAGNMKFIETSTAISAVRVERLYFAANGGAVTNLRTPLVLSTNTGLALVSTTVTNHSVTVGGYIA